MYIYSEVIEVKFYGIFRLWVHRDKIYWNSGVKSTYKK